MDFLKIPDNGVMLKGNASKDAGSLPPQAFAISLSDNVIENMIKCVQTGGDISLALGENPSFHYGSDSHTISAPESQLPDLYLTKPFESTREAYRLPLTMSIFSKPNKLLQAGKAASKIRAEKPAEKKEESTPMSRKSTISSNTSSSSNIDSDIEALRNGIAAQEAAKGRSVIVNALPASRKGGKAKGNIFTGSNTTPRSVPQSPALKPNASPLSNMSSAADQAKERVKQLRKTLVHELAVSDQSMSYLEAKFDGPAADFRPTLDKVAVANGGSLWKLRQSYWRDLDPYAYRYKDDKTRNIAIENAIKVFDKQRISPFEPEWQRLLPVEERGKGKSLSRLQEKLAKGPPNPPPKITLQKPDDSSTSKDDDPPVEKPRPEKMSRSVSNPLAKPKKLGTQSAAKRVASTSKAKPSTIKASPTKPKIAAKPNGRPALSQEFIENSDSSGDEAVVVERPRPVEPRPVAKPAAKPAPKPEEKQLPRPKPKPVVKEPAQRSALKRPPTDDDSSSSSGTPLSKRMKMKQPLPSQKLKNAPVEVRKAARDVSAPAPGKNKNTSPVKSSPLASSPPTNASDLSEDERRLPKKRKANGDNVTAPAPKRHAPSAEVMSQAAKFEAAYQQYYTLHFEIAALKNPPMDKLDNLNHLRSRLQVMKAEIYKKHGSSRH